MKLFLFSGKHTPQTNLKLINLTEIKKPTITYIPSSSLNNKTIHYFNEWKKTFDTSLIGDVKIFYIDRDFTNKEKNDAFSSDIIYLSGGDTLYFWNNIVQKKLVEDFKNFAMKNKVLSGLSAGSIILTSTLNTISILDEELISKLPALGLTNFAFLPHYQPKKHQKKALKFVRKNKINLVALTNNSVLWIDKQKITIFGKHEIFCSKSKLKFF